jgi:hypothetical protein
MDQCVRVDDVGQLAQHCSRDPLFPRRYRRLYAFLAWAGEDQTLRHQFKLAHREWRAVKKGANNG